MLCEGELWPPALVVLPDENTLERSVAVSECSNELRAYDDPLVSDIPDAAEAADADAPAPPAAPDP
jgi:hypothetical protein